jgi:putative PIN family toxin of toxin-antitoxin system
VKLVLDTNVLLSGSLWKGVAAQLMDAVLDGDATLCVSESPLAEFADVLQRDKFRARLQQSGQDAASILARFREVAHAVEPVAIEAPAALRDPDDVPVLACAISAAADLIVTGDLDLLALKVFEGIPIVEISEAMRRLGIGAE